MRYANGPAVIEIEGPMHEEQQLYELERDAHLEEINQGTAWYFVDTRLGALKAFASTRQYAPVVYVHQLVRELAP